MLLIRAEHVQHFWFVLPSRVLYDIATDCPAIPTSGLLITLADSPSSTLLKHSDNKADASPTSTESSATKKFGVYSSARTREICAQAQKFRNLAFNT
ncbi:hypothetical protein TcasGA2_TC013510 [Tribolium castaneum]|uniref:Uncharacterized protein n=1 Tax=Tribolium castaneum TaxID=7070 RepID=D6WL49_TRICA|nr:hypothetical protein TcasGA2_TC013510 [Tribolium castaneum]